jgi:predicted nucleotidyltransferase
MASIQQLDAFRAERFPTEEKVELAVKTAIEAANPSRVFLFGSWPLGEATPDSDLDLAVFVPDERKAEIGDLHTKIRESLRSIPMRIDLIVATEGHVAEFLDSVNSVYYKIVWRGKLVYDSKDR